MNQISETLFDYSTENIHFGGDNQKAEKKKRYFLQLKQKICRTNDVIREYSNKVKECERLTIEIEIAKKEAEEWKAQHFTSLAKVLKLNTQNSELEKSKKNLTREVSELELKIAADKINIQQLMCKLEDIEDQHSVKLMDIELQKSGLKSRINELEKELKSLNKKYEIKNDGKGNMEKLKKVKKIKSPMKTTRSTGLLPEILNDKMNCDIEMENIEISHPSPNNIELNSIANNKNEIDKKIISTSLDLPNIIEVDTLNDKLIKNSIDKSIECHLLDEKPITCDKKIMTDEFYSTKSTVYPLLCDKCESLLEPAPIEKIFKTMTALPPVIMAVPPSPVRSKSVVHKNQYTNTPLQSNIVEPNVTLALEKLEQSLEILQKKMNDNEENRKNNYNTIPNCSHILAHNCCNHKNLMNDINSSQIDMMAAFWTSMMKFTNKKLSKRRIKRKKLLDLNLKRRKQLKNTKNNSNSWTIESDISFADATSKISSDFTLENEPTVEKINVKKKINQLELGTEKNQMEIQRQNSTINIPISPHVSTYFDYDLNHDDITNDENSFTNLTTSTPSYHLLEANNEIIESPIKKNPTVQKQKELSTSSIPKNRTGLLQKLRRLNKNNKSVNSTLNITKSIDYFEPISKNNTKLPAECATKIKKRIAHVNKEISREFSTTVNDNNRNITRLIIKSDESLNSTSPKLQVKKSHIKKTKSKNISNNIISNLFGSDNYEDTDNESNKVSSKNENSVIKDDVHKTINTNVDIVIPLEHVENNDVVTNVSNDQRNTENLNIINQNIKSTSLLLTNEIINEKINDKIDKNNAKMKNNNDEISSQLEIKNLEDSSKNIQIHDNTNDDDNVKNKNIAELSCNKNTNKQDCNYTVQLLNSSMNSPVKKILSVSVESPNTNFDSDEQTYTLRKRRKIDNTTECEYKTPLQSTLDKNKKIKSTNDKSSVKSTSIITKSNNNKSIPEIMQNELGRFFNNRGIITRSMKKNENSLLLMATKSPIIEKNISTHNENQKTIKKLKTPIKKVNNNTSLSSKKSVVKNLLSSYSNEETKYSNNIDNNEINDDSKTIKDLQIDNAKVINSPTNIPLINDNNININNKSKEIINNVNAVQKNVSTSLTDSEIKITENTDIILSNNKVNDEDKINNKNSSMESLHPHDNLKEISKTEIINDLEKSIYQMNPVENIHEFPSTCTYDSSSTLDYPASPDPNTSIECTTTTITTTTTTIPIMNDITLPVNNSIQHILPSLKSDEEQNLINSRISNNISEYQNNSVKELRNRNIPVIPKIIPTSPKINLIHTTNNEEIIVKPINIKALLDQHLLIIKKNEKDIIKEKYHTPAAIKVTEEIVDTIKQEIKRIIDTPNWDDSIFHNVVDNILKINNVRCIVKAIVDLIRELSLKNEDLDRTHTPPAPLMTRSQQKIIALIISLNKVKIDLISLIFDTINYILFHVGNFMQFEEIEALSRIFIVLAKIKKDRERVRIMICDAIYSLQRKSHIVIHIALTCWAEVLPIYDENQRQCLPMCIVHIIQLHVINYMKQNTKRNDIGTKSAQLRNLIKHYYKYPDNNPLSNGIVDELLKELVKPNYDKSVITAIMLLAKKEGTEWTYKNIIKERLLKIIIENENSSSYNALILLGYLMKCFPLNDTNGAVKSIVEQLCAILNAGTMSIDIQEGVVMALLIMSTRHIGYPQIFNSILKWQPSRSLSSALQKQLEVWFNLRTPLQWQKIKIDF